MTHNFAILECKKCHHQAAVAIGSKRQIKEQIRRRAFMCPKCEGRLVALLAALVEPDPVSVGLLEVFLRWFRANATPKGQ